ncbi:hypothetical protein BMS77_03475 [Leuconostoc pseudomesenteroides]|uniref:DUF2207 domain-containing protein n=1 Tax=Leuconostoc pseudomesenteroides TaxID=33968 RepID=A0A1X0VGU3_LEUPS|nr:DUF2207 domain-containing protein [Leuconostoc pseudomesenteroides]OQJ72762.1 hypothetical protein BMS77_03475 [Leuconostoc pseudomesenteroides]OQJ77256.1 hypothetical protein BMS83_02250 [Leuconostoc pseudomesenteroides]OQJ77940.1 hypothetical protein BMS82_04860 [Leuconostoc pseudomesenteroides]ORI36928.1 hypothetical protein BMR88_05745 [Leuconostoc pseudomesenteroides]ORI46232.1 hypothetical protein BMR94_03615 [Leuconostoc pseudomesenteroides]
MKWRFLILTLLFAMFGIQQVSADDDYEITNWQQTVAIQPNGDANVTKQVSYSFDDDMHGVVMREGLAAGKKASALTWGGLKSIKVAVNGQAPTVIQPRQGAAQTGYVETKTSNAVKEKVYYPVRENDKLVVTYQYVLKGLVTNWDDVAEINWRPISDWDVDLDKAKLVIKLPKKSPKQLKAWVHSRAKGDVKLDKAQGEVIAMSDTVSADESLEIHMYFDSDQTPLNQLRRSGKRAKRINQQEAAIVVKHNRFVFWMMIIAFLVSPILFVIVLFIVFWQNKKVRYQQNLAKQKSGTTGEPVHIFDLPNDLGPALIAERLAEKSDDAKIVVATLLDLVARHKITMTYQGMKRPDEITYQVTDENGLQPFELSFVRMIFGKNRDLVRHGDFKKKQSPVSKSIRKRIGAFKQALAKAEQQTRIVDKIATQKATDAKTMALGGLIVLSVISAVVLGIIADQTQVSSIWAIIVIESVVALVTLLLTATQKTIFFTVPDGMQEQWQWQGFKKMLHDIAHLQDKQVLDVQLWDKILAYAVIFGEAKNVANQMKIWAKDMDWNTDNTLLFVPYYLYGSDWSDGFVTSINQDGAFQSSSNVSGGGGSFSGGSSGGAGGGGGGAF